MKTKPIDYCKDCEADIICSECLYTQLKYKDDVQAYTEFRCNENKRLLDEVRSRF